MSLENPAEDIAPVPTIGQSPSMHTLANNQADLGMRTEDQYKGLLNHGVNDQFQFDDNSFYRSEAAMGTHVDPGQLAALKSKASGVYGDYMGKIKFQNALMAKSLQFQGLDYSFEQKMKAEEMLKAEKQRRILEETNRIATRNHVIGTVLGIAGMAIGTAIAGPEGGIALSAAAQAATNQNQIDQNPKLQKKKPQRSAMENAAYSDSPYGNSNGGF